MGTEVIQIKSDEDGCVYIYNLTSDTWSKLCDIETQKLPQSVRVKVQKMQRSIPANT
jgi:hypothetical protein